MKRFLLFVIMAGISMASGYLMSKSSWIGKVGMTFMYREYNFTKVWWEGAIFVFVFLLFLYLVHSLIQYFPVVVAKIMHFLLLAGAVTALYLSYDDFHTDMAHRMLKHHFHYGVYLIWIGWMGIALFYLFLRKKQKNGGMPIEPQLRPHPDDLTLELRPNAGKKRTEDK